MGWGSCNSCSLGIWYRVSYRAPCWRCIFPPTLLCYACLFALYCDQDSVCFLSSLTESKLKHSTINLELLAAPASKGKICISIYGKKKVAPPHKEHLRTGRPLVSRKRPTPAYQESFIFFQSLQKEFPMFLFWNATAEGFLLWRETEFQRQKPGLPRQL